MTKRHRVLEAVSHRQPDFVPYQIDFTQEAYAKAEAYYGREDFQERIGNHFAQCFLGTIQEVRPGHWQDEFGVTWNRTVDKDIGVIEHPQLREPTLAGYKFPQVPEDLYRPQLAQAAADAERFRVAGIGFSMFERAWTLRGMENLLMDMLDNPAFVDELLDAILNYQLKVVDLALEYDFDAIHFGDDWGQQQGTIMGARFWRRFIKPRVARLYARARQAGKIVSQHSCGDIRELLPDLIDIGLNVFNTFQPEIMDPAWAKRQFGRHLTFWGGISTQRILPFKSPAEVADNVRFMLRTVGSGGGYICAPTHAIPRDVPIENMVAMIDVLQNQ